MRRGKAHRARTGSDALKAFLPVLTTHNLTVPPAFSIMEMPRPAGGEGRHVEMGVIQHRRETTAHLHGHYHRPTPFHEGTRSSLSIADFHQSV